MTAIERTTVVLFDLDSTPIDSAADLAVAINELLALDRLSPGSQRALMAGARDVVRQRHWDRVRSGVITRKPAGFSRENLEHFDLAGSHRSGGRWR
jgi:phosphoglycolate phosphatase-like HAD superfamily hydrolase